MNTSKEIKNTAGLCSEAIYKVQKISLKNWVQKIHKY